VSLTAADYKTRIVREIGDDGGYVDGRIEEIWSQYDSVTDLNLHYLYAKRKGIDDLIGKLNRRILDEDPEMNSLLSLKIKLLEGMWTRVDAEITTDTATAQVVQTGTNRRPITGLLVARLPSAYD
jgi:hypothetical protein